MAVTRRLHEEYTAVARRTCYMGSERSVLAESHIAEGVRFLLFANHNKAERGNRQQGSYTTVTRRVH